jgi:putative SOS response-associated peptidase YedK
MIAFALLKNCSPCIWEPWTDTSTGEHVETVAIVTTQANKLMEIVHNSKKRMQLS